jgi:hypothetical protein
MSITTAVKEQLRESPIATISTIVGTLVGIIAIITFGGTVIDSIGKQIVTPADLEQMEDRITHNFEKEAITIRTTYIADLTDQIAKLNTLLAGASTMGEVALYQLQIQTLNNRINTLQGKQ